MKIKVINGDFSVCKVDDYGKVNLDADYCFIGKTDEEKSLVCRKEDVPSDCMVCDEGWRALRIEGTLDFSLIGILAKIAALLADQKISIFAISTYNTDYILVKKENFEKAVNVLKKAGYEMI